MKRAEQTKCQLVDALKDLTRSVPFSKITVSDIADRAGVSRKSFYYHFKDKYDLAAQMFRMEFLVPCGSIRSTRSWFEKLCGYLYEQRSLYRNVLDYDGQNSFGEYLGSCVRDRLLQDIGHDEEGRVAAALLTDAMLAMVHGWLTKHEDLDAECFLQNVHTAAGYLKSLGIH